MSEEQYTMRGRDIYSPRGKLVATLDDDGNPVMAPGMAGAHSKKLAEWLGARDAGFYGEVRKGTDEYGENAGDNGSRREEERPVVNENLTTEGNTTVYVGQIPARRAEGGVPEETPRQPETLDEYSISTIPDDELPPFSKEYGVNTPGFGEFVKRHKLTGAQVAALVKRLEH